ncbi:MAG TPA: hypothetical protein PLR32_01800, partial [candidate division Zixibacteria bacterium]|nr:hypothetical protein [candidate division Zixibacteria bacterium]
MRRLVAIVLLAALAGPARADFLDEIRDGSRAYAAGDYKKAMEHFHNAEADRPEDPRVQYNIGGTA